MKPLRILVVTGSRALTRTVAARRWARFELAARIFSATDLVDVVAHGVCPESPDVWADELAVLASCDAVKFPARSTNAPWRATPYVRRGTTHRPMTTAMQYVYATPLERNAMMARWAGDMLAQGHNVTAIALRCPWPLKDDARKTEGAAHCRDHLIRAIGAARVVDLECPREFGPTMEEA